MNLLTNMPSLYKVLDAATANLDTSEGLGDIPTLAGLASSLRNINVDNIQFVTTPFEYAGARVTLTSEADTLWKAIAGDKPFTSSEDEYGNISIKIVQPSAASSSTATKSTEPAAPTTTAPADSETTPAAEPAANPTTEPSAPVCTKDNAQG